MNSKSLHPRLRILSGKEVAFGPGKAGLLALVAETGSIGEAAKKMDMSYMRAWTLIRTMNACFKTPVIKTARGGQSGGGAELTPAGRNILALYKKMECDSLRVCGTSWKKFQKFLR